jgi:hypothetical protein
MISRQNSTAQGVVDAEYCACCGKELIDARAVWLELDSYTNLYHEREKFPLEGLSQGLFPLGRDCAKRELKKAVKK